MAEDVLPSWRDGATRTRIVEFLDRGAEIPPADRVAVVDNDGTNLDLLGGDVATNQRDAVAVGS